MDPITLVALGVVAVMLLNANNSGTASITGQQTAQTGVLARLMQSLAPGAQGSPRGGNGGGISPGGLSNLGSGTSGYNGFTLSDLMGLTSPVNNPVSTYNAASSTDLIPTQTVDTYTPPAVAYDPNVSSYGGSSSTDQTANAANDPSLYSSGDSSGGGGGYIDPSIYSDGGDS